jgi:hypothetical protein
MNAAGVADGIVYDEKGIGKHDKLCDIRLSKLRK